MKRHVMATVLAGAMALSILAAPAALADGGSTLKFGCFGYADTMDPGDMINAAWQVMRVGVGECLYKFNDDMTVDYWLSDEYSTEDNRTWVFHIRDGVQFSDGSEVTAQDVVDSWMKVYDNEEGTSSPRKFMDYETIEADDDARTVTVTLKAAVPNLCKVLAYPVFVVLDADSEWDYAPVGTGPYALTAFESKVNASLTKNEYYWDGEVPFDSLEVLFLSEDNKAMAVQAGDVDLVENITNTSDLMALEADDNYNVSIAQGVRCGFAYMNFDGILADATLRRAIQMAMDDETMCNITVGGLYTPGMSVLPSTLAYGYENLTDPYAYDPAGAAALLDEAGYVDTDGDGVREIGGEKISLNYITYPNRKLSDFAEAIQATLTELGIEVIINSTDADSEWNMMVNGEYDLCDSNWTTVGTGDPTEYLANWYGPSEGNYCGYQNDEWDALYEELAATFDEEARADIIEQLQQILIDDAAVLVHGYYNSSFTSRADRVANANIHTADYYWITTEITPAQ